jgi:threonine dehydrogenase-like Zn-dependent dehydrogenase
LTKAERRRWLKNIPEPAIGSNDVVIRVRYTGIGESEGVVLTSTMTKFVACWRV